MNLMEGRIGKQEAASAALLSALISGIFALNTSTNYANGNPSWLSSLLGALLALAVFLFVADAMRRSRTDTLHALFCRAFGSVLGGAAAVLTAAGLLVAAGLPLIRMLLIMGRYVYVETAMPVVALYFVPCVVVLVSMGLEPIGRTMKLFLLVSILSIALAFVIAIPSYERYRLYPILGGGLAQMLGIAVTGMARFLPALLALLVLGRGVQTHTAAVTAGSIAAVGGGIATSLSQLCLSMTYEYETLETMHSPIYRLTMSVRTGSSYLRTDKLLLFFWAMAGILTCSFYTYAAALLFCQAFSMRDIRPAAFALGVTVTAAALMGQLSLPWFERAAEFAWKYLWLLLGVLPALAAGVTRLRGDAPEADA